MKKAALALLLFTLSLQADDYGALLFHGNCTTCHDVDKTLSAPSVRELKTSYMAAFPDKNDFVGHMAAWVQHPTEKSSIMPDAVGKHGLMPELGFDLDTLHTIAAYIYETDFSKK